MAAIELIASHWEAYCASWSKTIRAARSRTSWGYFFVRAVTPSLSRDGASGKPGAVQFNQPRTLEGIFALNDVELIDLETDPDETRNLAVERKKHGELLLAMNGAMNALIEARVGERDDGSFLPGEEGDWAAACFDP